MGEEAGGEKLSEVIDLYTENLLGLTFNSKPVINNLTIIAGQNPNASAEIVKLIESRILNADADKKLPIVYLLDSIIKNIGGVYLNLFSTNIINTYCTAFEQVDTNNRISLVHLLKTWIGVFPQELVTAIQDRISALVPSPQAQPPPQQQQSQSPSLSSNAIHVNPRYLQQQQQQQGQTRPPAGRGAPPPAGRGAPAKPSASPGKGAPLASAGRGSLKTAATTPTTPALKGAPTPKPSTAKPPGTSQPVVKPGAPKPPTTNGESSSPTASLKKAPGKAPAKPPGTRPPLPKKEGEDSATSPTGAGRGRGSPPAPPNGKVAKPGAQELKPTGRGRVEHHATLSEQRDHPYKRPVSKFGEGLKNPSTPPVAVGGDQQAVMDALKTIEQQVQQSNPEGQKLLEMLKGLVQNKSSDTLPQPHSPTSQQQPTTVNPLLQNNPASNIVQKSYIPPQQQQQQFSQFNQQQYPYQQYNNLPYQQQQQFNPYQQQFQQYPQGYNQYQQFPGQFPQQPQPAQTNQMPVQSSSQSQLQQFLQPLVNIAQNQRPGFAQPNMPFLGNTPNAKPAANAPFPTPNPMSPPASTALGPTGPLTDLKRQDRFVVARLYNEFTLQCKVCALRFNDSEKMAKHLDWHFTINRKEKLRAKQAMSRPWYHSEEDWAESHGADGTEKASTPFFESEQEDVQEEAPAPSVIADETQPICPICHENFEQFWDSDQEEWMYRAAMTSPVNGLIVHQKCFNPNASNPPDATMTSPPTSPRAQDTPPAIAPVSMEATGAVPNTATTATFSGVQGIDDLSF